MSKRRVQGKLKKLTGKDRFEKTVRNVRRDRAGKLAKKKMIEERRKA